jgi:colicin import membrane protein
LKQHSSWKQGGKQLWQRECKSESLKVWLDTKVAQELKNLKGHTKRSSYKYIVLKSFGKSVTKYEKTCKLKSLKIIMSEVGLHIKNFFRAFGYAFVSMFAGKQTRRKARRKAALLFKEFVVKTKRGDFDFCPCSKYVSTFSQEDVAKLVEESKQICKTTCSSDDKKEKKKLEKQQKKLAKQQKKLKKKLAKQQKKLAKKARKSFRSFVKKSGKVNKIFKRKVVKTVKKLRKPKKTFAKKQRWVFKKPTRKHKKVVSSDSAEEPELRNLPKQFREEIIKISKETGNPFDMN